MKAKSTLLALMAVLTMPLVNGCYTQMARPDREAGEPEYSESTEPVEEESYSREDDVRREMHAYPHDYDYYYGYRNWGWDPWWYRYPRTGLYVGIGYGFYDPYWSDPFWGPGWCGGSWDPWWGPSYWYSPWSRPGYIHYPVYDPYPGGGHDVYTPEKRPFGRRTSERERRGTGSDQGAIARRGSLSRPNESIYVRGDDGSYRRERRRIALPEPSTPVDGTNDDRASDRRRIAQDEPAPTGTPVSTPPTYGGGAVAKPASTPTPDVNTQPTPTRRVPDVNRQPARGTKENNTDGDSQRRVRPVEKGSRPAREDGTSRRNSNDGNGSSRRGYSGNSGSSNSPSGGSSSGGSSSPSKGSSSGSSSSGSSRRSKN